VRRGASWTAASHVQLTVAAVARPVRRSVMPSQPHAAERSWLVARQTASARPSVQPASSGRPSSPGRHCQDASYGVGRRSVSTMRCPLTRCRRPGSVCPPSGVQPVRCPVTWGCRPGSGGPDGWCPPVQRPALWCPAVRCPAVRCPPRRSGRVRLLPQRAVALGSRPVRRGTHHHRNRSRSRWAAAPSSGSVNSQQA
jgi:hypothetical protein